MTTGTKTYNWDSPIPGYPDVGRYSYRSWSGGDSPNPKARTLNNYDMWTVEQCNPLAWWRVTSTSSGTPMGLRNITNFPDDRWSSYLPSWPSNKEISLLSDVAQEIRQHEFNMGTFLGEGRESLNMIAHSASSIYQALRSARRFDFAGAARHLGVGPPKRTYKDVSSGWLGLQYGWLPLLGDTKRAAEALANLTNKPAVFSVKKTKSDHSVQMWNGPSAPGDTSGIVLFNEEKHYRRTYKVLLKEAYSPVAGLGLLDPEVVAWELVPYSFVVDWFIPIGNYLETRAHVNRLGGTWIRMDKRWVKHAAVGSQVYNGNSISNIGPSAWRTAFSSRHQFTRTILSSPPSVPLPTLVPLDKVLSWKRAANAVALLTNFIR